MSKRCTCSLKYWWWLRHIYKFIPILSKLLCMWKHVYGPLFGTGANATVIPTIPDSINTWGRQPMLWTLTHLSFYMKSIRKLNGALAFWWRVTVFSSLGLFKEEMDFPVTDAKIKQICKNITFPVHVNGQNPFHIAVNQPQLLTFNKLVCMCLAV